MEEQRQEAEGLPVCLGSSKQPSVAESRVKNGNREGGKEA